MGVVGAVFSVVPLWLIVSLILVVLMVILMRTTNQVYVLYLVKNNFFLFFLAVFFIIFAISITHIHTTYDFDLTSAEGISQIIQVYVDWLIGFARNLGKVTSYAIQQDWVYNKTAGGK